MKKRIAVIPGDGIGPEVVAEALKALKAIEKRFGHVFELEELLAGGAAIDACGASLPDATLQGCRSADAVLLGAVGGPRWDSLPGAERPERALLGLRAELGLFCNLRPVKVWSALKGASPLKSEVLGEGFDLLIVRELTGGVYFGAHERKNDGNLAQDTMSYSCAEVERVTRIAFDAAQTRRRKVTSVDKANVLETSRLWRETVERVAKEYPEVELEHLYVDNAAMQLVRAPRRFDVLLTENMFGDILSDEASQLAGSIGVLPSASLRSDGFGMYEPIHGSAPDIAGRGLANPVATILSVALLLERSFGLEREARAIERAVEAMLDAGVRSADLAGGGAWASTSRIGDEVVRHILNSSL